MKPIFLPLASLLLPLTLQAGTDYTFPVSPFTFLGRISDWLGEGYDDQYAVTLTAAKPDGTVIAQTQTFHSTTSRANYRLIIPLSNLPTDKEASVGDSLILSASGPYQTTWVGIVSGTQALITQPGGVASLDIKLIHDANGDGIDDDLYDALLYAWESSPYYDPDTPFDPRADHDGDGPSTLDEAYASTDPFDPLDSFRITDFSLKTVPDAGEAAFLSFPTRPGHIYTIEATDSLEPTKRSWQPVSFYPTENNTPISLPVNLLSFRHNDNTTPATSTIYLAPTDSPNRFFRIKAE